MLKPKSKILCKKGPVWALGGMSGTSVDGVDAAMILTDGEQIFEFGKSAYLPYSKDERAMLLSAMGKWPQDRETPFAAEIAEISHVKAFEPFLAAGTHVDLIGFHGQTLAHDPLGQGTHQAGDGRILAQALGVPVVWDFRTSDVEMGGQGAPLAPFFHFACAKWIKATDPVVFLNLGGVGNVTWVDPGFESPTDIGALLAFDTGPANAPIDDFVRREFSQNYDKNGDIAAKGVANQAIVDRVLKDVYFSKIPPKSLDRNSFQKIPDLIEGLDKYDAVSTLTKICADSVAKATPFFPKPPVAYYVCGGGRKNKTLMTMLEETLSGHVCDVNDLGLDGDMLEAQAFAYLAVRVARGLPTSAPSTTGVAAPVGGGFVSHPSRINS